MKRFYQAPTAVLTIAFMLGLVAPTTALAASAPSLGTAASFSVLAALSMSSASTATVSGDLGLSPGLAVSKTGTWIVGGSQFFGTGGVSQTAQADALTAYNNLAAQTSSGVWSSASPIPGVWTIAADQTFTGVLTLNGGFNDVWVFQVGNDMTFNGSVVLAGNAQACNVFWQVGRDVTIASGGSLAGTLIASRDVTIASGGTVNGRIISLNSSLVVNGTPSTVSGPTCAPAPSGGGTGTINVVKRVINDNGGTATIADFPLFVNGTLVISGQTNAFPAPAPRYTVTETTNANYTQTFSGDCDLSGGMNINAGDNRFCIVTNDDIGAAVALPPTPPLIDVVKVPNPLALPGGPGPVTYTYTVRNIGPVPMTNVTMVGDTCTPITLFSGDTNGDSILDLSETWTYRCSTVLTETHTNTVVATGWANGLSAIDIASATVIVGAPVVPPLIHVTKVPSPLALRAGGGMVTYTERISNPGTVALSNVTLTDDKCAPLVYISGDTNADSRLDVTETWTYTCRTNLVRNTTNTAIASGTANGLTVRDFAVATVLVAFPTLPSTGLGPVDHIKPWSIAVLVVFAGIALSAVGVLRKRTNA